MELTTFVLLLGLLLLEKLFVCCMSLLDSCTLYIELLFVNAWLQLYI